MYATAARLLYAVLRAYPQLLALTPDQLRHRPGIGKWSPQEIIGHLTDSAANNHQRFVRAQLGHTDITPYRYAQDAWVQVQDYASADWPALLTLWQSYQTHLAHLIARLPASLLDTPLRGSAEEEVSLRWLADDYVRHLRHHIGQIFPLHPAGPPAAAPGESPFWISPLTAGQGPLIRYLGQATYEPYYPHIWKPGGLNWYMERCFGEAALHSDFIDPNITYWVPHDEHDDPIGLLKLGMQKTIPGTDRHQAMYLEKIYLLPEHFGQGRGQQLMEWVCALASRLGHQAVWLYVLKSGPVAAYERAGFRITGSIDFNFDLLLEPQRAGWLMVREL